MLRLFVIQIEDIHQGSQTAYSSSIVGVQTLQRLKAFLGCLNIQTIIILACNWYKNCQRDIFRSFFQFLKCDVYL